MSTTFTVTDAQRALIRIGSAARRCELETALREEHLLFLRTIQAIAAGSKDAQLLAATALQSKDLTFDRGE